MNESNNCSPFFQKDVLPNTVMAFYAGVKVFDENALFHENMTLNEAENVHKNFMSYSDVYTLDIPPGMDDIVKYRATLAHKAQHSFTPNVEFDYFEHPRFGHIRCLISNTFIKKGEEIFVNYEYDIQTEGIPR